VMLHRARRMMWPLASVAGFVTLLAVATYGAPRLRAPLDVALLVLAAVPIERGLARVFGWDQDGPEPTSADQVDASAGTAEPAPASEAATRAHSTASRAPLTTRYSVLRRCETAPTRSPSRLWIPI
jgi:hypothetical protein